MTLVTEVETFFSSNSTQEDEENVLFLLVFQITHDNMNPIYHPNPGRSCLLSQMSEAEQIRIAKRMGLLSHLPMEIYTPESKEKLKECIICMCEYIEGEELRYLPCLHTFHKVCIDDWLMRSFTCPFCLEPVETGLLAAF